MRSVSPGDPSTRTTPGDASCSRAILQIDARITRGELELAKHELAAARSVCGAGHGIEWRRGWIERAQEHWDRAALAYMAELREATPIAATGAQLLETLEHASPPVRRRAAQIGSRRWPIRAGFEGVDDARLTSLRCEGTPRACEISCNRETMTCTYRCKCQNGSTRTLFRESPELWFVTR